MTKDEALKEWNQAASAEQVGKEYTRTGNWEPLDRALRHCSGEGEEIEAVADNVIRVTVAKENARAPFLLMVR